eukprot:CAMPEP_0171190332 /NCGR_PEP_ID=MMETSP0790-20130122/18802_1 /TAXON_ID=2925 /ORGANISM="Alexandrium catenella, Strain OF101" /LENGTH=371 /DNA_ID=CAMNT_0011655461 /DNA_START=75 /DNA_END=1190 /DNA_ORIENTATION=+
MTVAAAQRRNIRWMMLALLIVGSASLLICKAHTDLDANLDGEGDIPLNGVLLMQLRARLDPVAVSHEAEGSNRSIWVPPSVTVGAEACRAWLGSRKSLEASTWGAGGDLLAQMSPEVRSDICTQYLEGLGMQEEVLSFRAPCNTTLFPGERLVYFVRHGQAWSNKLPWVEGGLLLDPLLTPLGVEQAKNISSNPVIADALSSDPSLRAELVVVSPMRRTLETAIFGLNSSLPVSEVPWRLDADIMEVSGLPCDSLNPVGIVPFLKSLGRADLVAQYEELPPDCFNHTGRFATDDAAVRARFNAFTESLLRSDKQRVVAVAHQELLRIGLGTWVNGTFAGGPLFKLAEVRSYALAADGSYRPLSDINCFPAA